MIYLLLDLSQLLHLNEGGSTVYDRTGCTAGVSYEQS